MGVCDLERRRLRRQGACRQQQHERHLPELDAPWSHSLDYIRDLFIRSADF